MKKKYLEIDLSGSNEEDEGEDKIEIQLKSGKKVQFNFSNFFFRSTYVFKKYSEIMKSIEREIKEIENKYEINEEAIIEFIEIIEKDKVFIPIEHYKDIYTLSKHFCYPKLTKFLDDKMKKLLVKDLNFAIQILLDNESKNNSNKAESEFVSRIENFLKTRVNECLKNENFKKLSIPTIYRIINSAILFNRESVDLNVLLDFIFESAESRFILFKFVELQRLNKKKIDEFINFIDEQEEHSKQMYLENIPFDFSFLKKMKYNYDNVSNDFNQIQKELIQSQEKSKQKQEELKRSQKKSQLLKEELQLAQEKSKQTQEELKRSQKKSQLLEEELQRKQEELQLVQEKSEQTQEELKRSQKKSHLIEEELQRKQEELQLAQKRSKQKQEELKRSQKKSQLLEEELQQKQKELQRKKEELQLAQESLKQTNDELEIVQEKLNHIKSDNKKYSNTIFVGGLDNSNNLGEEPNKLYDGTPVIYPCLKSSIDPSSLLSYSTYWNHSVQVTKDGQLLGIGDNRNGQICDSLPKKEIKEFTEFAIKNSNGRKLEPISAVCSCFGTLYMLSSGYKNHLVLCDKDINGGHPVFLDIGDEYPVALFGGYSHSAAINNKGEIIFINRNAVIKSPELNIKPVCLPDGEKAVSVACCDDSVLVLSSSGRVFLSYVDDESNILLFSTVQKLIAHEIVWVSGTCEHIFAISKDGRVFGRGSNLHGQLGLNKRTSNFSSFTEISLLNDLKIKAAYAGVNHSLFVTIEGKIFACGNNYCGELLIKNGIQEDVYSPTETMIPSLATFCIAGDCLSAVFIEGDPPPQSPNRLIVND